MKQTEFLTHATHVNGLHESKFPFVSRIEFIRSKLSNFSAHVYGVSNSPALSVQLSLVSTYMLIAEKLNGGLKMLCELFCEL